MLIGLLIVANALNIAADLVAVGAGMHLLHAGPAAVWALDRRARRSARCSSPGRSSSSPGCSSSCASRCLTYVACSFVVKVELGEACSRTRSSRTSSLSRSYIALLVAVLGTTISPYLFFWQTAHRVEELRDEPEGGNKPQPLRDAHRTSPQKRSSARSRFDVFTGMAFSNIVMFAIIVATAATLGTHGKHNDPQRRRRRKRAATRSPAGSPPTLFALGFIGSGMLAIPVLAGSGAAGMAGLLGKRLGLLPLAPPGARLLRPRRCSARSAARRSA